MKIIAPSPPRLHPQLTAWKTDDPEVEADDALLRDVEFVDVRRVMITGSRLERVAAPGASLEKLDLTDVECTKMEAAGMRAYKASLLRVCITDSRFTGAEFAESCFEDCTFRNAKFDAAGFRFATLKRVVFDGCVLRATDFSGASLTNVTFVGCDFEDTIFTSAKCQNVDVATENITGVKGVLGLKGSMISQVQLGQLAPLLAAELGFYIQD